MSLQIRSAEDGVGYVVEWREGYKRVTWDVVETDDLAATLQDILATVEANHSPLNPVFLAPGQRHKLQNPPDTGVNEGELRAHKEAIEQEMALRNGGAALARGIGFDGVPTMDDGDLMSAPPPPGWTPVNFGEMK